jgi:hypothetical protein
MPEPEPPEQVTSGENEGNASASPEVDVIPPEAKETLKKLMDEGGPNALMSVIAGFSRVGPDPQTAKVLADAEKHNEELRLKGGVGA